MCVGWSCDRTEPRPPQSHGRDVMTIEVKVPDIGDFKDVPVIEVR
jgi:hypothetical protein